MGRWSRGERERAGVRRLPLRLMGEIAESTLNAGGEVTGVEPEFFVQGELQHEGLTELIVTKDMTERKRR